MALDKFRTGDGSLTGAVLYSLTMPAALWFVAEIADALNSACDPDNWEKVGSVTIDEAVQAAILTARSFLPMVGTIFPIVTGSPPDNTLLCDGSTYNRVDYPALYAALDAAFVVDEDTFTVPDLRGKTIIGASGSHAVGASGGAETHTLVVGEMPAHTHSTGNSLTSAAVMPGEGPVLVPNPLPASTGSTGGDGAHNNMQPYCALKYVVVAR